MGRQASSKGYLSAQCVSTFLICIIYYGQNHNREHSHGQYYVLAQWLLLKRSLVSWIHIYACSHACTTADTCMHTPFVPTGPFPEKPCFLRKIKLLWEKSYNTVIFTRYRILLYRLSQRLTRADKENTVGPIKWNHFPLCIIPTWHPHIHPHT